MGALIGVFFLDGTGAIASATLPLTGLGAGLAAHRALAVSVSRRLRARLVGQGIVAHFAELAARTFRVGFQAGVIGEIFDQVEELDAPVLGDGTLEDTAQGGYFGLGYADSPENALRICRSVSRVLPEPAGSQSL